jgi:hypothetical protein
MLIHWHPLEMTQYALLHMHLSTRVRQNAVYVLICPTVDVTCHGIYLVLRLPGALKFLFGDAPEL